MNHKPVGPSLRHLTEAATGEGNQMKIFVFGGVSPSADPELVVLGERVGSAIAAAGHTMLCGGRADGIIGSAIDAAIAEGRSIIGVLDPSMLNQQRLHRGVNDIRSFDTREERRDYLNEEADAFIALPGGFGTLSELTDIIARRRESSDHKIIVLLGPERFWQGMEVLVDSMYSSGLISLKDRSLFRYAKTAEQMFVILNTGSRPSS